MTAQQTAADHHRVAETVYDAVVVGSGVSGAIIARHLAERGRHVLVLEAGPGAPASLADYEGYLTRFYAAPVKDNNAPYPVEPRAPMPRSTQVRALTPGVPDDRGYLVQNGPVALDSTYTRVAGGTTMHWEAKALRMLPEDFSLRSRYGVGRDWPLPYRELVPYYERAERELGVSGDVADQRFGGLDFGPGYVYPMHGMPLSYLDRAVARGVEGTEVLLCGERYPLRVRSTPQARNGVPNTAYDGGRGYVPVGAVSEHQADEGGRCQGNINCVPICPVQAKYNARKTLAAATATGRVEVVTRAVASRVRVADGGQVEHVEYRAYADSVPGWSAGTARGRVVVLAANPVENARLMLASGLPGGSGQVGRNLMDHMYLLSWGLMPEIAGTYRGTQCTAGFEDLRAGSFRRQQAAFRMSIHNDGWGWATGSPYTDLHDLVDNGNRFGPALRSALVDRLSRQFLLDSMVELLPDPANRITVDPDLTDGLGIMRPILSFAVSDYTLAGVAAARQVAQQIFQRLGVEDHTAYDPGDYGYVTHQGQGYQLRGGNHWAGTHIMGSDAGSSVVDVDQRCWDHDNLYLVGPGSMPSIGTANTTLTLAALCLRSAERIDARLQRHPVPAAAAVL